MTEMFKKYIKKDQFIVCPNNIYFKTNFTNCIKDIFVKRSYKEAESELEWDIIWADRKWMHEKMDYIHLAANQKVNHFRNSFELGKKDSLIKNLKRYKKVYEKENPNKQLEIFSKTYNIPNEQAIFEMEYRNSPNQVWILKPISKSQGTGIELISSLSKYLEWKEEYLKKNNGNIDNHIIQKYITNPLLIGGKKFDLRIYVLCTNFSPLTIYCYREGFGRFSHCTYDNIDLESIEKHLTNVAIQKKSKEYDEDYGGKWSLRNLKLYLIKNFGDKKANSCYESIQEIIIHTLKSVQKKIINDKQSFELYGFDVLIDDNLKCWMLEVNCYPSLTANTPTDKKLKIDMLDDLLTILNMEKVLTGEEIQIGGFDLIYKGGKIEIDGDTNIRTFLGTFNNREEQLKQLAINTATRLLNDQFLNNTNTITNKKENKKFSTLPQKKGAIYKEHYKDKIAKEKEENLKEKKIEEDKKEENKIVNTNLNNKKLKFWEKKKLNQKYTFKNQNLNKNKKKSIINLNNNE